MWNTDHTNLDNGALFCFFKKLAVRPHTSISAWTTVSVVSWVDGHESENRTSCELWVHRTISGPR